MDIKKVIQQRQSIRSFSDKKPSMNIIHEIIKYANLAPSAGNLQPREFIIVDNHDIKNRLCIAALNQEFIVEAPIVIVVCVNYNRIAPYGLRGRDLYCIQDSAASIEHILLFAVDSGLGACWIGAFHENEVSKILHLPSYVRPVAIIPIGYPEGETSSTSRIDTKVLTHHNRW